MYGDSTAAGSMQSDGEENEENEETVQPISTREDDLRRAVRLRVQNRPVQTSSAPGPTDAQGAPRRGIDECIAEFQMQGPTIVDLPRVYIPSGDTLVFVDPPPHEPGQDNGVYKTIVRRYSQPFRVRSQTLNATGSPVLERMLGSTAQYRIRRQRRFQGIEMDGAKYIINLTPPNEGEEAASLTADLSCPLGLREWVAIAARWRVADNLVGGVDEFQDKNNKPPPDRNKQAGSGNGQSIIAQSSAPLALEYSPLRHRLAIERVLRALEGLDPQLDSAPKVFTTVIVAAKQLGIGQSLLTDYVVRWLRATPNSYFVEAFPETTLQMADCLKCGPLVQDAYQILVGEAALEMSCQDLRANSLDGPGSSLTMHLRKMENLNEAYQTRIQYARTTFVDRVKSDVFNHLIGPEMSWLETLPEFRRLSVSSSQITNPEAYAGFRLALKDFVKGAIYHLLTANYYSMPGPNAGNVPAMGDMPFQWETFKETWESLRHTDRIFTRSFWLLLQGSTLPSSGCSTLSNFDVKPPLNFIKSKELSDEAMELERLGFFYKVDIAELRQRLMDLNRAQSILPITAKTAPLQKPADGPSHALNIELGLRKRVQFEGHTIRLPTRDTQSRQAAEQQATATGLALGLESSSKGPPVRENLSVEGMWGSSSMIYSPLEEAMKWSTETAQGDKDGWVFNLYDFFKEVERYLSRKAKTMLSQPNGEQTLDLALTNTLVCLQEPETKLLPLWAGGNDDGSNGVFSGEIPLAYENFSSDICLPDSQGTAGDFEMIHGAHSVASSSVPTSKIVNDGYSDTLDRRGVYAYDAAESILGCADDEPDAGTMDSESTWDDISTPTGNEEAGELEIGALEEGLRGTGTGKGNRKTPPSSAGDADSDFGDFADESDEIDDFDEIMDYEQDGSSDDGTDKGNQEDVDSSNHSAMADVQEWKKKNPKDARAWILYKDADPDAARP